MTPDVLNLAQASTYLGRHAQTLKRWLRRDKIPGRRIGRSYVFSRQALERWLSGKGAV